MDAIPQQPSKFSLGQIVATAGALAELEQCGQAPTEFLERHRKGDWGELNVHDAHLNDQALQNGARILSAYRTRAGSRLWIITEAEDDAGNRQCTTLLLPQEY